jgi:hypothetical protein
MTTADLRSLARKAQVDERTATRWLAGLPVRPAMAERLTAAKRSIEALAQIDELFQKHAPPTVELPECTCAVPAGEHGPKCPALGAAYWTIGGAR